MPRAHPKEFRDDVVAKAPKGDASIVEVARDFGISESSLRNWLSTTDVEDGRGPGVTEKESAELREQKRRNGLLEPENDVLRRAVDSLSQANLPGKLRFYGWRQAVCASSWRNTERLM